MEEKREVLWAWEKLLGKVMEKDVVGVLDVEVSKTHHYSVPLNAVIVDARDAGGEYVVVTSPKELDLDLAPVDRITVTTPAGGVELETTSTVWLGKEPKDPMVEMDPGWWDQMKQAVSAA